MGKRCINLCNPNASNPKEKREILNSKVVSNVAPVFASGTTKVTALLATELPWALVAVAAKL